MPSSFRHPFLAVTVSKLYVVHPLNLYPSLDQLMSFPFQTLFLISRREPLLHSSPVVNRSTGVLFLSLELFINSPTAERFNMLKFYCTATARYPEPILLASYSHAHKSICWRADPHKFITTSRYTPICFGNFPSLNLSSEPTLLFQWQYFLVCSPMAPGAFQ